MIQPGGIRGMTDTEDLRSRSGSASKRCRQCDLEIMSVQPFNLGQSVCRRAAIFGGRGNNSKVGSSTDHNDGHGLPLMRAFASAPSARSLVVTGSNRPERERVMS